MKSQNIKVKETVKSVKEKDNKKNFNHYIKDNTVHDKKNIVNSSKEDKKSKKTNNYATNKVQQVQQTALREASMKSKRILKKKAKENKRKKQAELTTLKESQPLIKLKNSTRYIKTKHHQHLHEHEYKTESFLSNKEDKIEYDNIQKRKKKAKEKHQEEANKKNSYQDENYKSFMKSYMEKKHRRKLVNQSTTAINLLPSSNQVTLVLKKVLTAAVKTYQGISNIWMFGMGLILTLVMTLFIGVLGSLGNNNGINQENSPVSAEVLSYEGFITQYAIQYGIEEYVPVIEAIMMQESGGRGNDPMQAAECGFNTKYPHKPNGIEDPIYSIEVGIQDFADCLKKAEVKSPSDTDRLYLALQGYNYGSAYIKWALEFFNGYSKANAQVYSDNMKQKFHTKVYGDPLYVEHVVRYINMTFRESTTPDFNNFEAWVTKNPYSQANLHGQCTWFAWGRFYELYGYSPGFIGNGYECVDQLLKAHPDKFERSSTPKSGAVFSSIGRNHVGIVLMVNGDNITIQEGNLDGKTNTFEEAKTDWHTKTLTLEELSAKNKGVVFANPK